MGETALTSDLGLATNSTELLEDAMKQFAGESGHILNQEKNQEDNPEKHQEPNIYQHVNQKWGYPYWATGNGWMTYGLMRVVSTIGFAARYCADPIDRVYPRRRQTGRIQSGHGNTFGRNWQSL